MCLQEAAGEGQKSMSSDEAAAIARGRLAQRLQHSATLGRVAAVHSGGCDPLRGKLPLERPRKRRGIIFEDLEHENAHAQIEAAAGATCAPLAVREAKPMRDTVVLAVVEAVAAAGFLVRFVVDSAPVATAFPDAIPVVGFAHVRGEACSWAGRRGAEWAVGDKVWLAPAARRLCSLCLRWCVV